ncbi:MAG TPA: SRPBCC domain-containing protein [Woeseiaceae bacterium]
MKHRFVVVLLLVSHGAFSNAQDVSPVVSEGIIDASVETVWDAWTTGEGLRSWLAPHASMDLRIGGLMRTNYDPAGALGDAQTIENSILSFDPGRMLSIKVARTPAGFPFERAIEKMWTVIYFEPEGTERTRLKVISLGFDTDEESQRMRAFFEQGNAATIEQLKNGVGQ